MPLLALAVLVRSAGIARPLVGNFATKNAVYAMVAQNLATGQSDLWHPTLDCLVGGKLGLHMVELPVSAYVTAGCWRLFGGSLDVWGRLTSLIFSVASVTLLYLMVRRWHGETAARAAGLVLALSPVHVMYGQSFMLESSLVCLSLLALLSAQEWWRNRRLGWLALYCSSLGLALLSKIYLVVLFLPIAGLAVSASRRVGNLGERADIDGTGQLTRLSLLQLRGLFGGLLCSRTVLLGAATLVAVLPAVVWYGYAYVACGPNGALHDRVFYSVRQSAEVHAWPNPILFSTDFYGQLATDLATVVLTPLGLGMCLAGLFHPGYRRHFTWLLAMGLLVILLPLKFHKMNYYFVVVLPPLCILAGLGWELLVNRIQPARRTVALLLVVGLAMSARYVVRPAFFTPSEDRSVVAAAAACGRFCKPDEPVVTMHGSTIDLLYYCGRRGWAISPQQKNLLEKLEDCRRQGAELLVMAGNESVVQTTSSTRLCRFALLESGDGFRIYDLRAARSNRLDVVQSRQASDAAPLR